MVVYHFSKSTLNAFESASNANVFVGFGESWNTIQSISVSSQLSLYPFIFPNCSTRNTNCLYDPVPCKNKILERKASKSIRLGVLILFNIVIETFRFRPRNRLQSLGSTTFISFSLDLLIGLSTHWQHHHLSDFKVFFDIWTLPFLESSFYMTRCLTSNQCFWRGY